MREHIKKMLENNTDKTWGEMRKKMTAEEIVEVFYMMEGDKVLTRFEQNYTPAEWRILGIVPPVTWILRIKPAKKEAKKYPIRLVHRNSAAWTWCNGYYAAEYDGASNLMSVDVIYACGKTPIYHFADNSTHYTFRRKGGEVAIAVSFKEDCV
jgi:hypothetical protein